MGSYLNVGCENLVGTATSQRLDDPWFQIQCWKDKKYQPRPQVFLCLHNVRMLPGRTKYSAVAVCAGDAL